MAGTSMTGTTCTPLLLQPCLGQLAFVVSRAWGRISSSALNFGAKVHHWRVPAPRTSPQHSCALHALRLLQVLGFYHVAQMGQPLEKSMAELALPRLLPPQAIVSSGRLS